MGTVKKAYSLNGILRLMARLGNVQDALKVIHIAGTNGKGSVGAYISAVLSAQGCRVGTYASPAVFEKREIIRLNGQMILEADFTKILSEVQKECENMRREEGISVSEFEMETAAAFCYFFQKKCDYAVIEAGLGGKDDATNVIKRPICSVFTSISIDHKDFLGDTLKEIATAKAGIIKPGCPCVSAVQDAPALFVLKEKAARAGSAFYLSDQDSIRDYEYDETGSRFFLDWEDGEEPLEIHASMTGSFQRENFACALETLRLLKKRGVFLSKDAVKTGLMARLPGRFEKILDDPPFYIDGGHNEGAARQLARTVRHCFFSDDAPGDRKRKAFREKKLIYMIGMLADKEYQKVLPLMLPYASLTIAVTPRNERALDGQVLEAEAKRFYARMELDKKSDKESDHGRAEVFYEPDMNAAAAQAICAAGSQGVVLAFGSFTFLKQLREAVAEKRLGDRGRDDE